MPMPEPMREASGITATQPISSSCLARMGSSLQYAITWKPSATSCFAATSVSGMLGKSVFASPSTSSFTSVWPSSSSRARRSVRTASSAL